MNIIDATDSTIQTNVVLKTESKEFRNEYWVLLQKIVKVVPSSASSKEATNSSVLNVDISGGYCQVPRFEVLTGLLQSGA